MSCEMIFSCIHNVCIVEGLIKLLQSKYYILSSALLSYFKMSKHEKGDLILYNMSSEKLEQIFMQPDQMTPSSSKVYHRSRYANLSVTHMFWFKITCKTILYTHLIWKSIYDQSRSKGSTLNHTMDSILVCLVLILESFVMTFIGTFSKFLYLP